MSDPLAPLFDDLRRTTVPHVRAPGPDAARRTVHRRATVRATAVAAVVLAAGTTFVVNQRGDGNGAVPAEQPSASASAMLWRGWPDKTVIAAELVPGADYEDVMGEEPQVFETEAGAGRHRVRVGCSGPAPLPFFIVVDNQMIRQDTIPCTDAGTVRDYEFTTTEAVPVRFVLGNAGQFDAYALKLTKI